MNGNDLMTRLGLIGLFVLVAIGVAVLLAVMPAGAVTTGDVYPGFGDWNVNNATKVIDEEIIVYGDLNVNSTLELWNATIRMDLGYDNQYMVNVTTIGNLKANDTLITSTRNYREYGFQVHGMMAMKRVTVMETYNGLRVLTNNTVLIEDSAFILSYGAGMYLENADGTTVRNVQIQTNELSVSSSFSAESQDSSDYQQSRSFAASGGALYVKDGNPSLKDVYVSANGTVYITAYLDKYGYYYMYMYLYVYVPIVGINSEDMKSISGVHIRDSDIQIDVTYRCTDHWTYPYAYWYLYTYGHAMGVNVLNYGDVELKGCTVTNSKISRVNARAYASSTGSAYYHYTYTYTYTQGFTLFGATIDKEFTTAGPHNFKVTLRDASFEDVGLLTTSLSPDYNGTAEPTFKSKVIIENVSLDRGANYFTFGVGPQFSAPKTFFHDVLIKDSTFTNVSGSVYQTSLNSGPGMNPNARTFDIDDNIRFENCTFKNFNSGSNGLFRDYNQIGNEFNNRWERHLEIVDCDILDGRGYIFYSYGNRYVTRGEEYVTIENCRIINNTGDRMMYMYYKENVYLIGNLIKDNTYSSYNYFIDYGGYTNGIQLTDFRIHGNTFINNKGYSGDYGLWYIYLAGKCRITNNTISDMETNFMGIYPYTYYSGTAELHLTGNEFFNINGTLLWLQFYYQYATDTTVYIEDNYGHDNNGLVTDYYEYYAQNYEGDPTIYIRNNTMEAFSGPVFSLYGKTIITGNTFKECAGYVINQDYISSNPPQIYRNVIQDCQDVYYLGAKDKGVLKISLAVSDLSVDCTGNAFYFNRMDATMTNVTITNRCQVAIIAEESNVDAIGSTIPIGSGLIIGNGEINVWFELEIFVEWANKAEPNVSSGVPVDDALVVMYGSTGAYYSSAYTDAEGHLRPIMIPQWTLKGSFLSVWSPYDVAVTKSGITQIKRGLELDRDYSGEDALKFLLVDTEIPVVRITSPFSGETFNSEELMMRGFSTEIGSGIGTIQVSIGDGDWMEVEFDENGDFSYTFSDLPEGEDIDIKAKVYDVATNWNETSITITIDRTPPRLVIFEPMDGAIMNQADIVILGEYEPGSTITINGLEREGTSGTLSEPFTLTEGRNTIVVMATDMAGNSASETRTLRLDRFSPTLTVLAPRDGLVTRVTNITVEGEVELGSMATISIYRTSTNTEDEVITPRPDGTFMHKVDLEEGRNTVVVTAMDSADNPSQVTRVVYVDTTAPMAVITSPEDGTVTKENTIRVTGTAEIEGITLYLNGKQVFNDGSIDRYVNLNEGANVITLRAVDLIGNEYVDSVTVVLDTQAPTIEPIRPRAQYLMTNSDTLIIEALVFENLELDSVSVMGNDVSFSPVTGQENTYRFETTATLLKEGENEVLVVARDDAGNVATHTITVDYSTERPMLFLVFSPSQPSIEGENPNFYISGTTNVGIDEVWVSHTVAGDTQTARVPVGTDGSFNVVRTLLDGANGFTVTVTDAHGNTNTTSEYSVTYKYKDTTKDQVEEPGIAPSTWALWILVIALALFITAIVVTRMLRRDQD